MKRNSKFKNGIALFMLLALVLSNTNIVSASEVVDGASGEPQTADEQINNETYGDVGIYNTWNYYQSEQSTNCSAQSGGSLVSYTERHKTGEASGNVKTYPYYLYSKYTGSKTVEEIKSTWTVGCNLKNSASLGLSANVGAGTTTTVSASATTSESWQWIQASKYYSSTNGSKLVYSNSNFTIAPYKYSDSDSIYLINSSYLKLKGDNQPYSISSGC
ncbi:hypothetical protein [Anaerocolumna xylanovorans]|uniref:Uncharacterized protein n=1 Tax=Anaerocolumna xylanovorans DSM 12503 TaxID=1121345 RepID=A0A1M7Y6P0_9FIRM|nr:hypothetical protein [Anaerocolumna xylanovorans]SHO48335.1 hypothetical protein SAMN02745217_01777 [Anaerocolumna xylanovorans DSM 12503]